MMRTDRRPRKVSPLPVYISDPFTITFSLSNFIGVKGVVDIEGFRVMQGHMKAAAPYSLPMTPSLWIKGPMTTGGVHTAATPSAKGNRGLGSLVSRVILDLMVGPPTPLALSALEKTPTVLRVRVPRGPPPTPCDVLHLPRCVFLLVAHCSHLVVPSPGRRQIRRTVARLETREEFVGGASRLGRR